MPDFNATVANGVALNSISVETILPLFLIFAGVGVVLIMLSALERYTWLMDSIEKLASTLKYTGIGILTLGVLYAIYLAISILLEVGEGIDPIWYAYAIGGCIAATGLGKIVSRMFELLHQMHTLYSLKKALKES